MRLESYLQEKRLPAPQDLDYRSCVEYLPWRKGRGAAHNTALLELKLLGVLCDEAIRRGIINRNPASKLGIKRERGKEKPELTDADIFKIRAALKSEPAWMSHAFEIALHTGCRLSETDLFRSDIDFHNSLLRFRVTKGDKPFTIPLDPMLKQVLKNALNVRATEHKILNLPIHAARDFHRFFKKLGLGVTFHSTRVTVASRLARSGYSISKAMRFLNHGSELVHRQYQRLQAEDVADAFDLLRIPPADADSQ